MKKCILILLAFGAAASAGFVLNSKPSTETPIEIEGTKFLRSLPAWQHRVGESLPRGVYIVRSIEEYRSLTDESAGISLFDNVDFATESVVIATLGECNTEGYYIDIRGLKLEGDSLQVATESGSPEGEIAYMAITFPAAAVVVPRLADSVIVVSSS